MPAHSASIIGESIIRTLGQVIRQKERPVHLHAPTLGGNCWAYLKDCIDTCNVSSAGDYVSRFERGIADFTGAQHAIAVCSGTAGLHVAMLMAGVRRDDEVLCPSLTFVATANAISYCGATPHFIDADHETLGVDPGVLGPYLDAISETREDGCRYNKKTGRRIAALIGMHAFGYPFDLSGIQDLCERLGIAFVEDAAESLGSFYNGKHTGTFAKIGVLSFNGNKIITTGGGGMILTDDDELAQYARHIATTAKVNHRFEYIHDQIGFNYRMPTLNAALGCAQLEQIDELLAKKRDLAERYADAFSDFDGGRVLPEPPRSRSNYWISSLILDPDYRPYRDEIIHQTCDAGFLVRPIWRPMHMLPMYADCPRMPLPVTEDMAQRVINIPGSAGL